MPNRVGQIVEQISTDPTHDSMTQCVVSKGSLVSIGLYYVGHNLFPVAPLTFPLLVPSRITECTSRPGPVNRSFRPVPAPRAQTARGGTRVRLGTGVGTDLQPKA